MASQARTKGAQLFAAVLAQSLSEVLAEGAGLKKPLQVADGSTPPARGAPVQYRIQLDGALSGECFFEFFESQLSSLLESVAGQRITAFAEEHKRFFSKFVVAAVKKIGASSLHQYGDFECKLEPVSGLSFGGMFVVPLAAQGAQPELEVQLYFDARLLDGLATAFAGDPAQAADDASLPARNLNLVMDVELNVALRFGKRALSLREVLDLGSGSVVELDRMVDEPIELYLDGKLIARGEAVVVDGNYGLRVTEIPQPVASHLLN